MVFSVIAHGSVEFFPHFQRYEFSRDTLRLKLNKNLKLPSRSEYEQTRDLLDETLRDKFPTFENFIKQSLNESTAVEIFQKSLDLLTLNHKMKRHKVTQLSLESYSLLKKSYDIQLNESFSSSIKKLKTKLESMRQKQVTLLTSKGVAKFDPRKLNFTQTRFIKKYGFENKVKIKSDEESRKLFSQVDEVALSLLIERLEKEGALVFLDNSRETRFKFSQKCLLFYYEEIMELIDKSSEELIAKNNRKIKMDEYVKKAAERNLFLSFFMDQGHLDAVEEYLSKLPENPFLRKTISASGHKVSCQKDCHELIQRYRAEGDQFLESLSNLETFSFDKYPGTKEAEKLGELFFNPMNTLLRRKVAAELDGFVYFLKEVENTEDYLLPKDSLDRKKITRAVYQEQKLNNLIFKGVELLLDDISFLHHAPVCVEQICGDILTKESVKDLLFDVLVEGEFKILRPKDSLIGTFSR